MRRERGFTLLEALLSVALISILAGVSLPVYNSFQNRSDLNITAQTVASMLRRAQVYARGANGDSQWGVKVQSTTATLFKGSAWTGHDTSYDETATIPGSTTVSGALTEVIFSKLAGLPSTTTGNVTLTTTNGDTRTVTINAKGMVSVN